MWPVVPHPRPDSGTLDSFLDVREPARLSIKVRKLIKLLDNTSETLVYGRIEPYIMTASWHDSGQSRAGMGGKE